ncbi:MAG: tRNA (guanosine(46)-N7)-methyltransferase TrmB [Bacteroides sp.]|nr:tRNA (guanosine(46)-N7)-methyltransferase TrmB [Eubacterium sp.]MCM1418345.1 tRNA (guanosine(46)-N7)-methyltransferase TrmB [Roseburia sp.]MCM1462827.1 tRNA (guanosine(46)-N7)-methyltransferase TrmB [Bacteroides sp.]
MRMRKKKYLADRLEACAALCVGRLPSDPAKTADLALLRLSEIFGNENPLRLEIGCGKGQFAEEIARRNPAVNFIAVEQSPNVLVAAMERAKRAELTNLKFISGTAEFLERLIPPKSVERIYLNFSCPFPKSSYAKHRLTHARFLKIYRALLSPGGYIVQKTDNAAFFEFSLNSFSDCGYRLRRISFDLHNSAIEGNIITEYEEKFSSKGFPIYYTEAFPLPDEKNPGNFEEKFPESSLQIPKNII